MTDRATGGDRRIAVPIAPAAGIVVGAIVAIAFLLMPVAVLEDMAVDSGIASLLTAAQPPLGTTARLTAAMLAGIGAGGAIWFGIFLLVGTRTMLAQRHAARDGVPVLRRADAHPDAPARRPVFAHRDLGTPFLEVKAEAVEPVERALPIDLDTPMANYLSPFEAPLPEPDPLPIVRPADPVAPAPIQPFTPLEVIAPTPKPDPVAAPRFAAHERIETFVMPPVAGTDPTTPLPQATIHDLLARLERGVARQQPAPAAVEPQPSADPSLEETLATLRALARRVG
ncbi:MAG: hypothetical protein J0I47_09880 [Sphingomonas sp.]|uniref:hypothetical protein n=1 Tax=Sphingomonas sp. TaxID=28214 RepID=UPI001AD5117F|nr:hypothetical protein [Sphingomonas sp.]MBN8808522.1 hypothetical protein [Sphingomonas sp.]